jgi:hypothetical protein
MVQTQPCACRHLGATVVQPAVAVALIWQADHHDDQALSLDVVVQAGSGH